MDAYEEYQEAELDLQQAKRKLVELQEDRQVLIEEVKQRSIQIREIYQQSVALQEKIAELENRIDILFPKALVEKEKDLKAQNREYEDSV